MSFFYPILFIVLYFYFMTILTPFYFSRFLVSISLEERSSEIIGQKYLSQNIKS